MRLGRELKAEIGSFLRKSTLKSTSSNADQSSSDADPKGRNALPHRRSRGADAGKAGHPSTGEPEASAGASAERPRSSGESKAGESASQKQGGSSGSSRTHGRNEGLVSHLHAAQQVNQRKIFKENPSIYYMNAESLSRPLELPHSARVGVIALIAASAIIASIGLYLYFNAAVGDPMREQAMVEENLSKDIPLDLPSLLSMLEKDDAAIDSELKAGGDTFFERSPYGSGADYEIIKLPPDVTLVDAGVMYAQGVDRLSAADAVRLLNGSWDLKISRSKGLNISLHYVDFDSSSIEAALTRAVEAEELNRGDETSSGDDDGFGNAYIAGTIMVNGTPYDWRVSAVPLSEVYSTSGLPGNSYYVGIRITSPAFS